MKFIVKEVPLDGSAHKRHWIVDIDAGTNFNYRGRTSFNAFFHGAKKRNYNGDILYYTTSVEEAREADRISQEFGATGLDFDSIPEVESIFKFYEIVGYDYKKKKFTF